MKRKKPGPARSVESATPKSRRVSAEVNGTFDSDNSDQALVNIPVPKFDLSREKSRRTPLRTEQQNNESTNVQNQEEESDDGSPTPTPHRRTYSTPGSQKKLANGSSIKAKKADVSAKRKSAIVLLEKDLDSDSDGDAALARSILQEEEEGVENYEDAIIDQQDSPAADVKGASQAVEADTPSRGRGRPKGSKNKRSPTPEGDLPPEERFFFQNRSGPPQISSNTLASVKLPTHEEYFEQTRRYKDHHDPEKAYLTRLHARSFPQWRFELDEGFNICLYGWGSKRNLVNKFAEWMSKLKPAPAVVIINGYTPKLNIRSMISTIAAAVTAGGPHLRLVGSPQEILETVLAHLQLHPPSNPVLVLINSIDAPMLRRRTTQSLFARLAADPNINLVATADTPSLGLLWASSLRKQLNLVFHDCTTYSPFDCEFSVVDEIHELLGRKGRRIGGKEGIGFVLKSLPENARNLYRVLLTELLALLADGVDGAVDENLDDEDVAAIKIPSKENDGDSGIEYRALYQKATEEFICSSDMNFRFLLKEFHDHQMINSTRDASGTELLNVPLSKEEIEGVLEDLVLG